MRETEWVELLADAVRQDLADSNQSLQIETQRKLPYGLEIRAYREEPETEAVSFATDFVAVEHYPDGVWKPRVVVEAKVGSVTTHDAITYSHKAANHKSVFPYLRYGIMLGNRQHYPLPGRLYRHPIRLHDLVPRIRAECQGIGSVTGCSVSRGSSVPSVRKHGL